MKSTPKWRYDDLPILPASWRFTLKADKSKQFELLRDLMRREDVTEVINACDAGARGSLSSAPSTTWRAAQRP